MSSCGGLAAQKPQVLTCRHLPATPPRSPSPVAPRCCVELASVDAIRNFKLAARPPNTVQAREHRPTPPRTVQAAVGLRIMAFQVSRGPQGEGEVHLGSGGWVTRRQRWRRRRLSGWWNHTCPGLLPCPLETTRIPWGILTHRYFSFHQLLVIPHLPCPPARPWGPLITPLCVHCVSLLRAPPGPHALPPLATPPNHPPTPPCLPAAPRRNCCTEHGTARRRRRRAAALRRSHHHRCPPSGLRVRGPGRLGPRGVLPHGRQD